MNETLRDNIIDLMNENQRLREQVAVLNEKIALLRELLRRCIDPIKDVAKARRLRHGYLQVSLTITEYTRDKAAELLKDLKEFK